jgi:hypothetical protein
MNNPLRRHRSVQPPEAAALRSVQACAGRLGAAALSPFSRAARGKGDDASAPTLEYWRPLRGVPGLGSASYMRCDPGAAR